MKSLCVFCGSSRGADSDYAAYARAFGRVLVNRGIRLVYGGASVGIMGALADAVLENGGEAIGVIPEAIMGVEIAHSGLTELRVVRSMHERKALMGDLSEGFVALPGGLGTLEELFEVYTWAQLGIHDKPVGLLNVAGYYDSLIDFLDGAVRAKFLKSSHRDALIVATDPAALVERLENFVPVTDAKLTADEELSI